MFYGCKTLSGRDFFAPPCRSAGVGRREPPDNAPRRDGNTCLSLNNSRHDAEKGLAATRMFPCSGIKFTWRHDEGGARAGGSRLAQLAHAAALGGALYAFFAPGINRGGSSIAMSIATVGWVARSSRAARTCSAPRSTSRWVALALGRSSRHSSPPSRTSACASSPRPRRFSSSMSRRPSRRARREVTWLRGACSSACARSGGSATCSWRAWWKGSRTAVSARDGAPRRVAAPAGQSSGASSTARRFYRGNRRGRPRRARGVAPATERNRAR